MCGLETKATLAGCTALKGIFSARSLSALRSQVTPHPEQHRQRVFALRLTALRINPPSDRDDLPRVPAHGPRRRHGLRPLPQGALALSTSHSLLPEPDLPRQAASADATMGGPDRPKLFEGIAMVEGCAAPRPCHS